ncbi:MAG: DUF5320 domain-containing protein [Dehalococcoidia bacterium]
MGRGYRWMYWATGLPGWMRGRGWGWPGAGWGAGWEPAWAYGGGPGYGAGPYWQGPWGAAPTVEDEVAFLKEEAEAVKGYLEGIERRISELEKTEK